MQEFDGQVFLSDGTIEREVGQPDNWRFILVTYMPHDETVENVLWIFDTFNGKGVRPIPAEGPAEAIVDYLKTVNEGLTTTV